MCSAWLAQGPSMPYSLVVSRFKDFSWYGQDLNSVFPSWSSLYDSLYFLITQILGPKIVDPTRDILPTAMGTYQTVRGLFTVYESCTDGQSGDLLSQVHLTISLLQHSFMPPGFLFKQFWLYRRFVGLRLSGFVVHTIELPSLWPHS